ncbi:MAG: hypothetical protein WBM44_20030, partial [Waterburya sp.]
YGWPIFPSDNEKDAKLKPRLVDPIASLTVIENLAIFHKKTSEIENKDQNYNFILQAWKTSLQYLTEQKILFCESKNNHSSGTSTTDDNQDICEGVTGLFKGYHDICRSLLAITGIFEKKNDTFMGIIEEDENSLSNKIVQIINTLIEQLRKDIISIDKIHDRGRVFRRSNGVVVQYVGVGSAFILYSILRTLSVGQDIQQSSEIDQKSLQTIIRTLIIQVLQQIITEDHIEFEPTKSLFNIRETMRNDESLRTYDIIGGYVFDECLPGKADAYEFIFFWQSAYALRALLLCQDLAKKNPEQFSWLTKL